MTLVEFRRKVQEISFTGILFSFVMIYLQVCLRLGPEISNDEVMGPTLILVSSSLILSLMGWYPLHKQIKNKDISLILVIIFVYFLSGLYMMILMSFGYGLSLILSFIFMTFTFSLKVEKKEEKEIVVFRG